jgi:FkbM family methyltransferase
MSLRKILEENGIPFENDKIKITAKHIKLDVGLSYSAPQSQEWLNTQPDLMVFGFEPNTNAVSLIKQIPFNNYHIQQNTLCVIPVALGAERADSVKFYVTTNDEGCSSLYKPDESKFPPGYTVKHCLDVPLFKLSDFFELLPPLDYIDYIKIDAQGSDLDIVKGGGDYLRDKVVFVTLEPDGHFYVGADHNNTDNITQYMNSIGFLKVQHTNTRDPTYVNSKFMNEAQTIYIRQG